MSFAERVRTAVRERGSPICLGLDPRVPLLPGAFHAQAREEGLEGDVLAARACELFCRRVLELAAPHVPVVKPQAAFFECHGSAGVAAFESVCRRARELGLIVLADVKRGDIGSTAAAYARAYLAPRGGDPPLADACTVSPYLGTDGLQPFLDAAVAAGGGVFVLVRTSNPSSGEVQELVVDGRPLYTHVADLVRRLADRCRGEAPYGPVGAVVGATWPDALVEARRRMPGVLLLLPGYGAQGAGADDVAGAFDAEGGGALVAASRSLVFPWAGEGAAAGGWEERVRAAVETMREDLARALSGRPGR